MARLSLLPATLAVAALLVGIAPASRAFAADPATASVSLSGLDLNTRAGVIALRKRVRDAARAVCAAGKLQSDADRDRCRDATLADAEPAIRARIVSAQERARLDAEQHMLVSNDQH
jgi:UrcA family protein